MLIDRIYQPVYTLGPGVRIAVWTLGCSKHCPGCANPELWEADARRAVANDDLVRTLLELARKTGIHRITFTGGDPLEQADDLLAVLEGIRSAFDDVLVYTGYEIKDLMFNVLEEEQLVRLGNTCDVIVDGPYIAELNDGTCALRGSTNQNLCQNNRLHRTKPDLARAYDEVLDEPRRIQNVVFGDRALSIGIHGPNDDRSSLEEVHHG